MTQPALEEPKDKPETETGIAEKGGSVELLQGKAPPDIFHGGELLAGATGRPPLQGPLISAIAQRDQAVVVIQTERGTGRSTRQKVNTRLLAFSHAVQRGLGYTCERAEVWDGHLLGQLSSPPTAWEMNLFHNCHYNMAFCGPASSVDHQSFTPRFTRFIVHRERML